MNPRVIKEACLFSILNMISKNGFMLGYFECSIFIIWGWDYKMFDKCYPAFSSWPPETMRPLVSALSWPLPHMPSVTDDLKVSSRDLYCHVE